MSNGFVQVIVSPFPKTLLFSQLTECTVMNKQISNVTQLSLDAQICALMHSHLFRIRGSHFLFFAERALFCYIVAPLLRNLLVFCMCNSRFPGSVTF